MEERSDAALARAIAADPSCRASEAELCRRLAPRIRVVGRRYVRDASELDDLVQTVLMTTLQKLRDGAVDEPARVAAFVAGVCRRVAAGWRRGDRRRRTLLDAARPQLRELSRVELSTAALDRDRLAECVRALPERQRTVVLLTFYAEEDGAAIAEELGTSLGNVRVMRHRALASLHACVEGRER
ncbi:MAG TPA: sigma-70 family RNA polymerase sigma factor [Sandaracinaceae bacterium LLY-WYZ-13_1]|nr:sigma-70 family RNA polymerase sigma factor [Sandaracinaceae bacterium LLY-WYZ-13_1]